MKINIFNLDLPFNYTRLISMPGCQKCIFFRIKCHGSMDLHGVSILHLSGFLYNFSKLRFWQKHLRFGFTAELIECGRKEGERKVCNSKSVELFVLSMKISQSLADISYTFMSLSVCF